MPEGGQIPPEPKARQAQAAPPDPLARIADALERIADVLETFEKRDSDAA